MSHHQQAATLKHMGNFECTVEQPVEEWMQGMEDPGRSFDNQRDTGLPAYSAIEGSSGGDESIQNCCAFQKLDAFGNSDYYSLLPSPKTRFLGWVIVCRSADTSIEVNERLQCPMVWCREKFRENNYDELVKHLCSDCAHFSSGQYWCPYHEQEECFMPAKKSRFSKFSKGHFLRDTLQAIRRLGSKSFRKAMHHPSKKTSLHQQDFRRRSKPGKRPYVDDSDSATAELGNEMISELDGREWQPTTYAHTHRHKRRQSVAELPERMYSFFEMDGMLPNEFQDAPRAELDINRMSMPSMILESCGESTPESGVSPISPVTPQEWYSTEGFDNPISPVSAGIFVQSSLNADYYVPSTDATLFGDAAPKKQDQSTTLAIPMESKWFSTGGNSPRLVPSVQIDTSCYSSRAATSTSPASSNVIANKALGSSMNVTPYRDADVETFELEAEVTSPNKLVEELRGLFNTLFKLCVTKVCQSPASSPALRFWEQYPSAASIFASALGALHNVFVGKLPQEFQEIFGLSLLAYACALTNGDTAVNKMFSEIFIDLQGWAQAITNDADRDTYLQLVQILWSPEGHSFEDLVSSGSSPISASDIGSNTPFSPIPSQSMNTMPNAAAWLMPMIAHTSGEHLSLLHHEFRDEPKLLNSFRSGPTISLCSRLLETFEYLTDGIGNGPQKHGLRNARHTLSHPTQQAKNNYIIRKEITDPLTESSPGLEAFKPVVNNVLSILDRNPLISVRDVELNLLQQGKACAKSQPLYQNFVDQVQSFCATAAEKLGWGLQDRNGYYAQDIANISAIHKNLLIAEQGSQRDLFHAGLAQQKGSTSIWSSLPPGSTGLALNSAEDQYSWDETHGSASSGPTFGGHTESLMNSDFSVDQNFYLNDSPRISAPSLHSAMPIHGNNNNNTHATPHPATMTPPSGRNHEYSRQQLQTSSPTSSFTFDTATMLPLHTSTSAPASTTTSPSISVPPTEREREREREKEKEEDSAEGSMTCAECGKVLNGKMIWLRSNMQRHRREVHHTASSKKLVCDFQGCGKTFSRSSNLVTHQRTVHGMNV